MSAYQVVYTDLRTGTIRGVLPVESFDYNLTLSAPGAASFILPLNTATRIDYQVGSDPLSVAVPSLTMSELAPWKTGVFIERDNVCVWSGIVSGFSQLDVKGNQATLNAVGFHEYFRRCVLRSTQNYRNTDQVAIARSLLSLPELLVTFSGSGWVVPVERGTETTGVLRDRLYEGFDRHTIGDLIEDLANTENGFDFRYVSERDETNHYVTRFETMFPRSGRATNIVFQLDVNVDLLSATVDGSKIATQVEAVGSGEGASRVSALVTSDDESYPVLDAQLSFNDIKRGATLTGYANQRLAQGAQPIIIPKVSVRPNGEPSFGTYGVGDTVAIRGSYGLLEIDDTYRITELSVSVESSGAETVNVTVALGGMFA